MLEEETNVPDAGVSITEKMLAYYITKIRETEVMLACKQIKEIKECEKSILKMRNRVDLHQ